MLASIREYLPADVRVISPQGGIFIWMELPKDVSSRDLLQLAFEEGVEFAPGNRFFSKPSDGDRFLRLNFATQTPQEISIGIFRLSVALTRLTGNHP